MRKKNNNSPVNQSQKVDISQIISIPLSLFSSLPSKPFKETGTPAEMERERNRVIRSLKRGKVICEDDQEFLVMVSDDDTVATKAVSKQTPDNQFKK